MRFAIAMTLAKRPDYARQAIEGLRHARGIGDIPLVVFVDPVEGFADEMRSIVDSIDFAEVHPTFHPTRLGADCNIRRCWRAAFEIADYVIFNEEDVVYATDALEYHRWAAERFKDDQTVYSVTAYNRRQEPCPPALHHMVKRRSWFHPWGTGMWKDRWYSLPPIDDFTTNPGWDLYQHREAIDARGLNEVYPELSRCQNIGIITSVQTDPTLTPEWYAANHYLQNWQVITRCRPGPGGWSCRQGW